MANEQRPSRNQGGQRPEPRRSDGASSPPVFGHIKLTRPLDPELFNDTAQGAARKIAGGGDRVNKSTQLRRFYDELVVWEMRVNQQREKFDEYLPFIRMLNAKAAYAEGRKLVDTNFVGLMHHTLSQVSDADSLSACKLFWEAFMGFYKQERQD